MIEEHVRFQQAVAALEQGDLADAEAQLREVLATNPQHTGALMSYIQCLERQDRRVEALPIMGLLHGQHPENHEFALAYAQALRAARRFGDAVFPLRAYLQKGKFDVVVVALLAQTYFELNDFLNARAFAHWALTIDDQHVPSLIILADLHVALKEFTAGALVLSRAIKADPGHLRARLKLGDCYEKCGEHDKALKQYVYVRNQDPGNSDLWTLTGKILTEMREYKKAEKSLGHALKLNSSSINAMYHLGSLKAELGLHVEAVALFQKVIELDPDFAHAQYNLSLSLLALDCFDEGFVRYHWRFKVPADFSHVIPLPVPSWDGQLKNGLHLLIWTEQGIGDSLFFSRSLAVISRMIDRAGLNVQLTFACDPRVKQVFSQSFTDINILSYQEQVLKSLLKKFPNMVQVPIGDVLCWIWKVFQLKDLPSAKVIMKQQQLPLFDGSVKADPLLSQRVEERQLALFDARRNQGFLTPVRRIGIAWHSIGKRNGGERSLPLNAFVSLVKAHPEVQWVSLQYGDHKRDIQKFNQQLPLSQNLLSDDAIDAWHDLDHFMAQIHSLDLVLSIDNSIAHMSGAMGVETWLLLGDVPNWRWPKEGSDGIWYPNMTLFRWQSQHVEQLIEVIAQRLDQWLEASQVQHS